MADRSGVGAPGGRSAARAGRFEVSGGSRDDAAVAGARRIRCVGAVIRDARGRLLLIRRGHPPGEGLWSLPGGRVETGESDHAAVIREIGEETGLAIAPGALPGAVERPGPCGAVFDIRDYQAAATGGELAAGDDAADVRWVSPAGLAALPLTPGLTEVLTAWRILPGQPGQRDAGTGTSASSTE